MFLKTLKSNAESWVCVRYYLFLKGKATKLNFVYALKPTEAAIALKYEHVFKDQ